MKRAIVITLIVACFAMFWYESAYAIPAFARRYRLSCNTCHNPFPRLTPYGEEFAGNAFQLPDAAEPARSYADVKDDSLSLLRDFPIAARIDMHGQYLPDNDLVDSDFKFPDRAKLLSGGAIAKDVAYYFYFYMNEHGEVTGVEDAYIHFNNIGGTEFDIMLGQFQTSDPLFKRELKLTYEDYHLYKLKIGYSRINLAYDRGIMMSYTLPSDTDLVLELVNGNGIGEDEDDIPGMDNDGFKNVLFRVSQNLGETGLRLGGVFYYGEDTHNDITDEVTYLGVDGSFDYGEIFSLNAQYLRREDTNPFYNTIEPDEEGITNGVLVEAIYGPNGKDSKHYFTVLYNLIDSDYDIYNYESLAMNVTHMLRRNIKIFAEYGRDIEHEANAFTLGVVTAF